MKYTNTMQKKFIKLYTLGVFLYLIKYSAAIIDKIIEFM